MSSDAVRVRDAAPRYVAQADAQVVPPGFKRTEVGVIPDDWGLASCDALCLKIQDGTHFSPKPGGADRLYVTSRNIGRGILDVSDAEYISEAEHRKIYSRCDTRRGDLLLTKDGANTGNAAINTLSEEISLLSSVAFLRFDLRRCTTAFFLQWILSGEGQRQIKNMMSGNAITRLTLAKIKNLSVPVPPSSEQRAIAEALSSVDGLLGALEALIAKKRAIKQATMQQLLTGKTRLPGFSREWETKQIDELATVDPENLSSATDPGFSFNYISLEQVDAGRLLGFTEEIFQTAPSRARRVLRHDDVLMSTVRPNLMAHLHFKSSLVPRAVCSTGFAVLRARPDKADAGFLFAHLFGYVVNNRIEKILAGSNYPAISSRDVRMIELPCPPTVAEQTAIATVFSDMDAEIADLEARRDKTRAIKQGMMQQLLTGRVRLVKPEAVANA